MVPCFEILTDESDISLQAPSTTEILRSREPSLCEVSTKLTTKFTTKWNLRNLKPAEGPSPLFVAGKHLSTDGIVQLFETLRISVRKAG